MITSVTEWMIEHSKWPTLHADSLRQRLADVLLSRVGDADGAEGGPEGQEHGGAGAAANAIAAAIGAALGQDARLTPEEEHVLRQRMMNLGVANS